MQPKNLITEENFCGIECLVEETEEKEKKYYIQGIFMQANKKNRNGRIYEDRILRPVIEKYIKEQIETGKAVGELEHPSSSKISLDRVSHKIIQLEWREDDVYGKALVLNTPTGQIVKGLLEGGVALGVSSRGMGSLEKRKDAFHVKDDFALVTVDVVSDPSAPGAWVESVLENRNFETSHDENVERVVRKTRKRVQKTVRNSISKEERDQLQLEEFQKFIGSLIK
jgi:hypothetical protein